MMDMKEHVRRNLTLFVRFGKDIACSNDDEIIKLIDETSNDKNINLYSYCIDCGFKKV